MFLCFGVDRLGGEEKLSRNFGECLLRLNVIKLKHDLETVTGSHLYNFVIF
jgi:hypothetical protein